MPVAHSSAIYDLAEPQHGYFTAAQAQAAGVKPNTLVHMARRGVIERVSRAVYRIVNFPSFEHGQFMEAVLWPQEGIRGVLSHESALVFHGLSDANPAKVHITIPPTHRIRRTLPKHLVVHRAVIPPEAIEVIDGIPVTTPKRSILDAYASHLGLALIEQAIADGRRSGKLTYDEADTLTARFVYDARPARPSR
jgi:predicted transcriptional regulator of viral defense system